MDSASAAPQDWPNHGLKVLIPGWTLLIISTSFLVWRVVYGLRQGRKFMVCDYLLIIATLLNIAAACLSQIVVDTALGRHILDPSIGFDNIIKYSYYLWIVQIVNIIAVAFLKWSICAWLLMLKFSKIYEVIVWLSILMVTAFNFLAPVLTLFGCLPLEANWNYGYAGADKKCWTRGTLPLSYTQGISNVLTDVVYMAAPLVYLSQVQLHKRTQWGIRIVFLLSIPATICSIFKTVELKTLVETKDPTWDCVNLAIWSSAECSIGILIASLPPLRKAFDNMLQKVLPSTMNRSKASNLKYGYGNSSHGNHIRLDTYEKNRRTHKSTHHGDSVLANDSDSERGILENREDKGSGIVKTTEVTVLEAGEQNPRVSLQQASRSNEWGPSDDLEHGDHHAR